MNRPWAQAALYSAKNCAAALLALWISLLVGLPMPFWAMSTAYIVGNPLAGATRSKAIYRVFGTAIGAAAAVALVPQMVEQPPLLSLALALWVGGCLAVSLLDRSPRSYVLMLAGYTATIIGFPAVDRPETVFDIASARVTEIVLGIACATVMQSVFWPRSVGSALSPKLHGWLSDAERWLADAIRNDDTAAERDARIGRDRQQLAVDALDCAILATHVPFDTSHWREYSRNVQALLKRMLLLLPLLSGLSDRRAALNEQGDEHLAPAIAATRAWLDAGALPEAAPQLMPGQGANPAPAPEPDWQSLLVESFLVRLGQAVTILAESRQMLAFLDNPRLPLPAELRNAGGPMRLHADPNFAVLSGLSTAFAIMLTCVIWIWSGWADGASAAALTGVFCCLFAAMDNPVPAILRFGLAMMAAIPLAGVYLFGILPMIDGFIPLALVLSPPLLILGYWLSSPKYGLMALSALMGFCSSLALQENYSADFAHFLNSNLAQFVALIVAMVVTAAFRTIGADAAINRLVSVLHRDLARLAGANNPPDLDSTLSRATDQLALLTQRLGARSDAATLGFREVRLALNIVAIQHWRMVANAPLANALSQLLRTAAIHFAKRQGAAIPPPVLLLDQIDAALRLVPYGENALTTGIDQRRLDPLSRAIAHDQPRGRAALVAMRRNLFPQASAFSLTSPAAPAPEQPA
ncbi:MAG TPA: FUSC family protein [Novosphingobium sp.]|nr:FUSC family protein [Novosphingobium sp.]